MASETGTQYFHHFTEDVCDPVPHRQFVFTIPKRWYSNKFLGVRFKADHLALSTLLAQEAGLSQTTGYRNKCKQQRAALIKMVYEVDPLICPQCTGSMPGSGAGGEVIARTPRGCAISRPASV